MLLTESEFVQAYTSENFDNANMLEMMSSISLCSEYDALEYRQPISFMFFCWCVIPGGKSGKEGSTHKLK